MKFTHTRTCARVSKRALYILQKAPCIFKRALLYLGKSPVYSAFPLDSGKSPIKFLRKPYLFQSISALLLICRGCVCGWVVGWVWVCLCLVLVCVDVCVCGILQVGVAPLPEGVSIWLQKMPSIFEKETYTFEKSYSYGTINVGLYVDSKRDPWIQEKAVDTKRAVLFRKEPYDSEKSSIRSRASTGGLCRQKSAPSNLNRPLCTPKRALSISEKSPIHFQNELYVFPKRALFISEKSLALQINVWL